MRKSIFIFIIIFLTKTFSFGEVKENAFSKKQVIGFSLKTEKSNLPVSSEPQPSNTEENDNESDNDENYSEGVFWDNFLFTSLFYTTHNFHYLLKLPCIALPLHSPPPQS